MPSLEAKQDIIVEAIGNIGKWQWLVIFPLAVREIFTSWQMLSAPFLAMSPTNYWCYDAVGSPKFATMEDWQNFSAPLLPNGEVDKCNIFDIDYSILVPNGTMTAQSDILTKPCQSWVYPPNDANTLITTFNLVCNRSWLITTAQVVYMLGVLCGAFLAGQSSDIFGRRTSLLTFTILLVLSAFGTAFSPNFETFIALRMIIATTSTAVWTTGYVYCMEIVGGQWKTWLGIGLMFPWAIGYSTLPVIAYFIPNWSYLQLAISSPVPMFILFYYFIPECPRWLLSKGRVNEAFILLEQAAKMNGKARPSLELDSFGDVTDKFIEGAKEPKKATLLDLFRTPNLRKNTLLQYFNWFTTTFVYYGLTLNADTLIPGDIYINFSVSGLIEIPAYITCIFIVHNYGLRLPLSCMFMSSFVLLLLTIVVPPGPGFLAVVSLGKFGIICVFAIIYLHAAEIFPTVVRTTGLGTCSMFGRIGSMLAPIAGRELGKVHPEATIVLFAFLSLLAGIFTLWLPETKGLKTADTIEEGEEIGKNSKMCSCLLRKDSHENRIDEGAE